jgi:hypothetical protein
MSTAGAAGARFADFRAGSGADAGGAAGFAVSPRCIEGAGICAGAAVAGGLTASGAATAAGVGTRRDSSWCTRSATDTVITTTASAETGAIHCHVRLRRTGLSTAARAAARTAVSN